MVQENVIGTAKTSQENTYTEQKSQDLSGTEKEVGKDVELKESEEDSGLGHERSGSGSGSEVEVESSSDNAEPEGVYEVERVLDYNRDLSGPMYLVKWKDWESGNSIVFLYYRSTFP